MRQYSSCAATVRLLISSTAKIINFASDLTSIRFLESALLVGTTPDGRILLKDLRNLQKEPIELISDKAVIGIHLLSNVRSLQQVW